jgi:hypothetical protein
VTTPAEARTPAVCPVTWPGLSDTLEALPGASRRAVDLVYFQGRTLADAAATMAVDRRVVGAALAEAHRIVARAVMATDSDDASATTFQARPLTAGPVAARRPA